MHMTRLVTIAAVATAALALSQGSASAAGRGATVESGPVAFTLTAEQCPNLPEGTTIEGAGTEKSVTIVRTAASGTTKVINSTHSMGTATDQDGNTYVFQYSNSFRVVDTVDAPGAFSGRMNDHFSLSGRGPARLNNGFTARIETDLGDFFSFDPIRANGDPIDFDTGAAICDPL
jgi:hypothetical protein